MKKTSDPIERQDAIDAICKACANSDDYVECAERRPESTFCDEIVALRKLPSAQPDRRYDEWCTDCKEYDHERHCCPRWNQVIRTTLQEARRTGRWIEDSGNIACSECHIIWLHRRTAFCPNCGADMRGEQDE